jgi:general secretion pathway protein M
MSTRTGFGWHPLRQHALTQWQRLSPSEQGGLRVLGGLLLLTVAWWVLIAPALHTLQHSSVQRATLAQQQAHMLALQAQAQHLQSRTPLARDEALRQLQSLTPSSGSIQMQAQGERMTVQLKAVPAVALAQWLSQAREQAQALPLEAHLTRSPATSNATASTPSWDGSLVLRLPNRTAP